MIYFILAIISSIVFQIYLSYNVCQFGTFPSLSETYYLRENKNKSGWWFIITLFFMAFTLMPSMITLTEGKWFQFTGFLGPVALMFVGAAPKFKGITQDSIIHPIAAICAAVFCLTWSICVNPLYGVITLVLAALISLVYVFDNFKKSYILYLELIAFYTTYIMVFYNTIING